MSPKFPAVTSDEVSRVIQKIGFRFKRQAGSRHAIYFNDKDKRRTVVPVHSGKIIKRKPSRRSFPMPVSPLKSLTS